MPVILDLDGNGIKIAGLDSSATYFDMAGDGYKHRTAWAGAGDGVLVLDIDGDGEITRRDEIVFTEWDPTATNDMQALRNVFDTNRNGQLDSGDAKWSSFKILVTNADGTKSLKTFAELGIQSINLTPDSSTTALPDGSSIDGVTTFTRTDGTTGTAATVSLGYDANGYAVLQAVTHDADGSTTIDNKAFDPDGRLAHQAITTTTADGRTRTISFDRNGDGTIDQVQTSVTVVNADGSWSETVSNRTGAGVLTDRTVTASSATGNAVTIQRDLNGDGVDDQVETRTTGADGSKSVVVANFNKDGSLVNQMSRTTSADGLTQTVRTDFDGDGTYELTGIDATVVAADGSRVQTLSDINLDGSLRDRTVNTTSADGHTKVSESDVDGDGAIDLVTTSAIVLNADGSSTTTIINAGRDGTLRDRTSTAISADGLSKTIQSDANGDGVFDLTKTDISVVNADGSRTQTTSQYSADGGLLRRTVVVRAADGRSRTIQTDVNGDGQSDRLEVIAVAGDGSTTDSLSEFNPDGSLNAKTTTTSSADGLASTTQADLNGDGVLDRSHTSEIVKNADGSSTTVESNRNGDGSLRHRTITTVSADGLSRTIQADVDGDGIIDQTATEVRVLNANGSQADTNEIRNGDGSLRRVTTAFISVDKMSTETVQVFNTSGLAYQAQTTNVLSNGDIVTSVSDVVFTLPPTGMLQGRVTAVTSADGLSTIVQTDRNGDGIADLTATATTLLNADGSRTSTIVERSADGSLRSRSINTTSASGLSSTTQTDLDGDGVFDGTAVDVLAFNADGSTTQTLTNKSASDSVINQAVITTSANGLSSVIQSDLDGDGVFDRSRTDVIVLNADGGRTETIVETAAGGQRLNRVSATTSADARSIAVQRDSNGDGADDQVETTSTSANGTVVNTVTNLNPDGTVENSRITTTSADGKTQVVSRDLDGDGSIDVSTSHVATLNLDGSATDDIRSYAGSQLLQSMLAVTSDDGRSISMARDLDGDGVVDMTTSDASVVKADGSSIRTVTRRNADGSLKSQSATTASADGTAIAISRDINGDGTIDQTETIIVQRNATTVDTVSSFNSNGSLKSRTIATASVNGLFASVQTDANGDGAIDKTLSRTVTFNSDGSQTVTAVEYAGTTSGSVKNQTVTTTEAHGLDQTSQWSATNGQDAIQLTQTKSQALNADGSITDTLSVFAPGGSLKDRLVVTVAADGLSSTTKLDINGDGIFDRVESVVAGVDGSRTQAVTTSGPASHTLRRKDATTVSADGRSSSFESDTNGDAIFDRHESRAVNSDGSVTRTLWNTTAGGELKDKVVLTTSANGLSSQEQFDTNGDGVVDQTLSKNSMLNPDGSQANTVTWSGANGVFRKLTGIVSANSSSTQIDIDGDGSIDQLRSTATVFNADGTTSRISLDTYSADGSLKSRKTSVTSSDGNTVTTQFDSNGDGVVDRMIANVVAVDGAETETESFFGSNGSLKTQSISTKSLDGLKRTFSRSDGLSETTTWLSDSSGSYSWVRTVSGQVVAYSSHTIDAAGVDAWVWNEDPSSASNATVRIDVATEAYFVAMAERLYDTAFDRDLFMGDRELLAKYIVDGGLNLTQLATDLAASIEYSQRYGTVTNAQYIGQLYQNAFGHAASLSELANDLSRLSSGVTRGELMVAVSESAEHLAGGNNHSTTNNTDSGDLDYALEHTIDKTIASAVVKRLLDAALNRDATATEIEIFSQQILSGTAGASQIAGALINSSEFRAKYGNLSNSDFVSLCFQNSLNRPPSTAEAQYWASALNTGAISRGDFLAAIAESPDHLGLERDHAGYNVLDGGAGNDVLTGNAGDDRLNGVAGDDALNGGGGNDVLDGGVGNDTLRGGTGNDTYRFGLGSGSDTINNSDGGVDKIVLGAGIAASDLSFTKVGNDLRMTIAGASDQLTVQNWFLGASYQASVVLTDNSVVAVQLPLQGTSGNDTLTATNDPTLLKGLAGNDTLEGLAGDDTLVGGTGNDTLKGSLGNDTYVFDRGDGADTVYDDYRDPPVYVSQGYWANDGYSSWWVDTSYWTAEVRHNGGADTLSFGSGISASDIAIAVSGNDLIVGVKDPANPSATFAELTDKITLQGWMDPLNRIETLKFADGTTLDVAGIVGKLGTDGADTISWTASAATINGGAGSDSITTGSYNDTLSGGDGNDTLTGGAGNDMLDGGAGNDTLRGGTGNDTYQFGLGSGSDTINNSDGGTDKIVLGTGIAASDLTFARVGNDLRMTIAGASDQLTVQNWFLGASYQTSVVLADNSAVPVQLLLQGTTGNDTLTATNDPTRLAGLAGNDTLDGLAGDDTLAGGTGADTLKGNAGNDVYVFNRGDGADTVYDDYRTPPVYVSQGYWASDAYSSWWVDTSYWTAEVRNDGGADALTFGPGITASDLAIAVSGNDLIVGVKDPANPTATFAQLTDRITLQGWMDPLNRIETLRFADGTTLNVAGIVGKLGTDGADTISWTASAATINGGAGNDSITTGSYNDTLSGGDGNDTLTGAAGDDTLNGGDGTDTLNGGDGTDTLSGGEGADTLTGGTGNDTLDGGAGNDALRGGAGNDSYLFGLGYGSDTIDNSDGGTDRVVFGVGVAAADLLFTKVGNDLRVLLGSDTLTVTNWFVGTSNQLSFVLADGSAVPVQVSVLGTSGNDSLTGTASGDLMSGLAGNDTLDGLAGDDTLKGGTGSDTLRGGQNNDTYVFNRGDGADTVYDDYRTPPVYVSQGYWASDAYSSWWVDTSYWTAEARNDGGADALTFGAGISASDLAISVSGNDLIVGVKDPANPTATFAQLTDRITLQGWMDPLNRIETVQVGGVNRTLAIGSASNDTLNGTSGNEWLVGLAGNDALNGNAGNDVLDGAAGNDTLTGGAGSDTYLFRRGDGQDLIVNGASGNSGASGELQFSSDISTNQLWFKQSGNDLLIQMMGTTDQVTVSSWFSSSIAPLQDIKIAGGQQIDSGISQLVQAMATYSSNNSGFNPTSVAQAPNDAGLQSAIAAAWHS